MTCRYRLCDVSGRKGQGYTDADTVEETNHQKKMECRTET